MTMIRRRSSCEYQMASGRGMRGVRGIGLGPRADVECNVLYFSPVYAIVLKEKVCTMQIMQTLSCIPTFQIPLQSTVLQLQVLSGVFSLFIFQCNASKKRKGVCTKQCILLHFESNMQCILQACIAM